jgi:hypothetical protein
MLQYPQAEKREVIKAATTSLFVQYLSRPKFIELAEGRIRRALKLMVRATLHATTSPYEGSVLRVRPRAVQELEGTVAGDRNHNINGMQ